MSATATITERLRRQHEAVAGYRIFASHGWGDDRSGHISARDPEHSESFWLLRDSVAFAAATVADLVLVRPDGRVADDRDVAINPAAFCIHGPIHQARPDVGSASNGDAVFAWLCRTRLADGERAVTPEVVAP